MYNGGKRVNADWSVSPETSRSKCYFNYPIGQLSDFLLLLDPHQVPSMNSVPILCINVNITIDAMLKLRQCHHQSLILQRMCSVPILSNGSGGGG